MTPDFEVIQTGMWTRRFGAVSQGNRPIEIDGQVTHLQIELAGVGRVHAYVRENISGCKFGELTSGSRMGLAERIPAEMQVLELATDFDWERVAEAVGEIDALGRPVVKNGKWTPKAAREVLAKPWRPTLPAPATRQPAGGVA